eukprot:RCo027095
MSPAMRCACTCNSKVVHCAMLSVALLAAFLPDTSASNGSSSLLSGVAPPMVLPLLQGWAPQYTQTHSTVVQVGSSVERQLSAELDFVVTLDPAVATSGTLLIPVAAVPLVVTYNIPNISSPLNLSRGLLADIYAGNIRQWSDPAVRALNPFLDIPAGITVVIPQGSSARTLVFTAALCSFSASWKVKYGAFSDSSGFSRSTANVVLLD